MPGAEVGDHVGLLGQAGGRQRALPGEGARAGEQGGHRREGEQQGGEGAFAVAQAPPGPAREPARGHEASRLSIRAGKSWALGMTSVVS